jgi:GGDEF domain-containing protein
VDKIGFSVLLMIIYAFGLGNIDMLNISGINIYISNITYIYILFVYIIVFVFDPPKYLTMFAQTFLCVIFYTMVYYMAHTALGDLNITNFLIELLFVLIGMILASDMKSSFEEIISTSRKLAFSNIPTNVFDHNESDRIINYEINRSRRYEYPLTLLLIEPDYQSFETIKKRWKYRIMGKFFKQYLANDVLKIFYATIRETDVFVEMNDYYVIVLPNTYQQNAHFLIDRLRQSFTEKMKLSIRIGISQFPDDGLLYDDLIRVAKKNLEIQDESESGAEDKNKPD